MPSNAPFGFRPFRHMSGGVIRAREYPIASGYATTIRKGDPVKLLNDGTIGLAAAGDRILGVFQGCQFVNAQGEMRFEKQWTASATATELKATVIDDKNVSFLIQSGGTPAQTNVGNLADHVAGTGSDLTGQSGAYLDSTMGTGAAGFRILDIAKFPGNSGQYAQLEVSIFEHEHSVDEPATPGV